MAPMIEAGDFIESADVHGNYYGTSKAAVQSVVADHQACILDIDVQGVRQVKKAALSPPPLFIRLCQAAVDGGARSAASGAGDGDRREDQAEARRGCGGACLRG
eukprot:m.194571 g.194571  ORF g.194571 m.194571 type:complete len:104 (+) comp15213_c0_seq3:250-561(+)